MSNNNDTSEIAMADNPATPSARPVHVHHIHPASDEALLVQQIYAPFAPVVMVDDVEDVQKVPDGAKEAVHVPKGDLELELDEYPANIGEDIVIVDTPPDGGYGWVIVAASFTGNFFCVGIQQSFGLFLGYYLNISFVGTPAAQVSLISSLQAGCAFILGPLAGRMTDKYGPRVTALCGIAVQIAANVAASFCNTVPTLMVTQGIMFGLGTCLVQNAVISAPAQWFSKRLPLAFGISICGTGLGGLCLTFVTQALLNNLGPSWTLRVYAIMNAVILIPAALALKTRAPPPGTVKVKRPFINFKLFADLKFTLVFMGMLLATLAFPAPFFLPSFVFDVGLDPSNGANLLAIQTGVSAVSNFASGLLAPKVGILNLFCITQLLVAISPFCFWLPAGSSLAMLYVFAVWWGFFWGFFFGTLAPAIATLFSHLDVFPVVVGTIYLSISIAFFVNAPIFGALVDAGAIYDSTGARVGSNYTYALIWAGSIYLVGLSFIVVVRMIQAKWKLLVKV